MEVILVYEIEKVSKIYICVLYCEFVCSLGFIKF